MSLMRALTRRNKHSDMFAPTRASSIRKPGNPIKRDQISGPIALLSTTNMISYNAPNIHTLVAFSDSSRASSHSSSEETDASIGPEPSLTDASSVESTSPIEQDHLSGYFPAPITLTRSASARRASDFLEAPIIPKRALSHSKRTHASLARKRSLQFSRPGSAQSNRALSIADLTGSDRTSPSSIAHPFSQELEQLSEVAEDFAGVARDAAMDVDIAIMQTKGLLKFQAEDYGFEIAEMWATIFEPTHMNGGWI